MEEHRQHLQQVLRILRENKLYAKASKCEFDAIEVDYLGNKISARGIEVMNDKVEAIQKWSARENTTQLRSFLGLIGFY
ncbi:unnamed protein product [Calypogeia fissa]